MENKSNLEFTRRERLSDVYTDTGTEYSLPDYLGDVRRILFTKADVLPSGKFESGESVEFSGIVNYSVLYVDAENKMSEASFSSDYDFAVKCGGRNVVGCNAKTGVSGFSLKLIGPRKISVKAALTSSVELSCTQMLEIEGDAFDGEESVEVRRAGARVRVVGISESAEREYAEQLLHLDGAVADEISVCYTDCECRVDSAEMSGAELLLGGEIIARALINRADDSAFLAESKIRFDESVPAGSIDDSMIILPNVNISSQKCAISAEENGVSLVMNLIAEFSATGISNKNVDVIADSYIKTKECENSFEPFHYSELVGFTKDRIEHTDTVAREELDFDGVREVICLDTAVKVDGVEIEGDNARISGQIKYSVILSGVDENAKIFYRPFKHTCDFEENVNSGCQNEGNLRAEAIVTPALSKAAIEPSCVRLSTPLTVVLTVNEEKEMPRLVKSSVIPDTEVASDGVKVVVYYPDGKETLFDIAKKYHTTVGRIAADNGLTSKVSADSQPCAIGAKKLLILN